MEGRVVKFDDGWESDRKEPPKGLIRLKNSRKCESKAF